MVVPLIMYVKPFKKFPLRLRAEIASRPDRTKRPESTGIDRRERREWAF